MQFEFKSDVNAGQFDAIWGQMWGQCKSIRCNSRSIRGQPEVNGQFDAIWGQSEVNVAQFDAIRGQSEVNAGQSDAFRCQPEVKVDQKKKVTRSSQADWQFALCLDFLLSWFQGSIEVKIARKVHRHLYGSKRRSGHSGLQNPRCKR